MGPIYNFEMKVEQFSLVLMFLCVVSLLQPLLGRSYANFAALFALVFP